jgi:hypothetical protein
LKNIKQATSIKTLQIIINVFGLIYFCKTQIGISKASENTFQIAKNSQTKNIESKINQKKNTTVKWNAMLTNQIKTQTISKFFSFVSFLLFSIHTKFTIFLF